MIQHAPITYPASTSFAAVTKGLRCDLVQFMSPHTTPKKIPLLADLSLKPAVKQALLNGVVDELELILAISDKRSKLRDLPFLPESHPAQESPFSQNSLSSKF